LSNVRRQKNNGGYNSAILISTRRKKTQNTLVIDHKVRFIVFEICFCCYGVQRRIITMHNIIYYRVRNSCCLTTITVSLFLCFLCFVHQFQHVNQTIKTLIEQVDRTIIVVNSKNRTTIGLSIDRNDTTSSSLPITTNNNDTNNQKLMQLEFVHIPKTGGTFIEYYGAKYGNVTWGMCHYRNEKKIYGPSCSKDIDYKIWLLDRGQFNRKYLLSSKYYNKTTRMNDQTVSIRMERLVLSIQKNESFYYGHLYDVKKTFELWHSPPSWLHPDHSPYHRQNTALFTIVRNPYDRLVSEFYCPHIGYSPIPRFNPISLKSKTNITEKKRQQSSSSLQNVTSTIFNQFLISRLLNYPVLWTAHFIPQAEFVYNYYTPTTPTNNQPPQPPPRQVIHHILRYENLTSELIELMKEYNLSFIFSNPEKTASSSSILSSSSSPSTDHVIPRPRRINTNPDYFPTHNSTTLTKRFTRYDMNPTLIQLVNTIYRRDFLLFNYTMMDPNTHNEISMF
jgi:Sulfotransferase family